jgi:hypothetical protein
MTFLNKVNFSLVENCMKKGNRIQILTGFSVVGKAGIFITI